MNFYFNILKKINDYSKLIGVILIGIYLTCVYIKKIQETYPRLDRIEENISKAENRITQNDKNVQLIFEKVTHLTENVETVNKNVDFVRDKVWIIYNNQK